VEHKSRDEKKHIVTKRMWLACIGEVRKQWHIVAEDAVGLLLGEGVSTKKKTHIVAKDVVGLQVGDDDTV
jgi:hypothetical protein